jgi:hypothetical protein
LAQSLAQSTSGEPGGKAREDVAEPLAQALRLPDVAHRRSCSCSQMPVRDGAILVAAGARRISGSGLRAGVRRQILDKAANGLTAGASVAFGRAAEGLFSGHVLGALARLRVAQNEGWQEGRTGSILEIGTATSWR